MTSNTTETGYRLAAGEGEAIWFLGTLMTVKAGAEQTGGAFSLPDQTLPPGFTPPPHIHLREDEAFYILEGVLSISCGEQRWQAGPGDFVFMPRGIPHH